MVIRPPGLIATPLSVAPTAFVPPSGIVHVIDVGTPIEPQRECLSAFVKQEFRYNSPVILPVP